MTKAYSARYFIEVFLNHAAANHIVCHGIPSDKILKDGDIVNVDVTAIKDGWHETLVELLKLVMFL